MSVQFDGVNKLIICASNTTSLNVKTDIYSAWKTWMTQGDNSKYLPALSVIGGDEIGGGIFVGTTYFLENGWKIRPFEGDHTLSISGNIYTRDGSSPLVSAIGDYNILVDMKRSNIIDTVSTGGSTGPTAEQVALAVWNAIASNLNNAGSMAELIKTIEHKTDDILTIQMTG